MRFEKEDPKLIDYALGELDADAAHSLETALTEEENAAALREVDEIKRIAALAHDALRKREGAAALTEQQRTEVLLRAEKEPGSRPSRWIFAVGLSLAAAFLLVVGGWLLLESPLSSIGWGHHVPSKVQPVAKKPSPVVVLPSAHKEAPVIEKATVEPVPVQETPPPVAGVPVPETTAPSESKPTPQEIEKPAESVSTPESKESPSPRDLAQPLEKPAAPVSAPEVKEPEKPESLPMKVAEKPEPKPVAEKAVSQEGIPLEPIKIELPEPFFGGTPLDYWSPNLEPEDYTDRPPYLAPPETVVASKGKPVTSSCSKTMLGDLKQITDGDKDYAKGSLVELCQGVQWVQIDLKYEYDLYAILVWHFHEGKRVYFDVVVRTSNDPAFQSGYVELYNNDHDNSSGLGMGKDKEYIENNQGRLIPIPKGIHARYIRLYSNGNTANELNNYVEVEAFGKPIAPDMENKTAGSSEREAIEIELPEVHFSGTPLDYWGPQLEPEDYRDRPPCLAPKGTTLVSRGKPVTSNCIVPNFGNLPQITDGDKGFLKKSLVELEKGMEWVQIDLQQEYMLYAIMVWHFYERSNVYFDVIIQASNDPYFQQGVVNIYNNDYDNSSGLGVGKNLEYIENYKGRLFPVPDGVLVQYVRLYSQGNCLNELNHYVEVEVFGKPVGAENE
ncbi:MAG TPA: hypothetical protein PLI09_03290 [Candidatus Hydrogenedentes bacterium]|nr:hypothetical protein [Candidatus Hydrogenedentota bacterium]